MGLRRVARRAGAWLTARVVPVLFVAVPPSAAASGPGAAPRYETAPECPARQEWLELLHAKLPASQAALGAADALSVRIERRRGAQGNEYHGVVGSDRPEAARAVDGTSCREVFEALVLVAVLSLDDARGEPGEGTPAVANAPAEADLDEPVQPDRPREAERSDWGALGLVIVQSGIAPNPSLDVGAGLVAHWSLPGWEPWLLLGAYTAVASQTVRVDAAKARFDHAALRAVGCPWRYPSTGRLALRPCIGFDVGQTRGEGSAVSRASSDSALWLAALSEVRFEFLIHGGLSIGGSGGAALPLIRPRFYFEPGTILFQAPAVGFEAGGFAAWLF